MSLPDGRHFTPADFACRDKDRTPYPEEWADRWALIVDLCDAIRDLWGGPLIVQSGYRTPAHNAELIIADAGKGAHGVASSSQHVEGNAADLRTSRGAFDVPHLYRVVITAYEDGKLSGLGGLGLYPVSGWVHVDVFKAPDGHLRRWTGL
jgi:uncharacterized protein YcbK (DUF882 family)